MISIEFYSDPFPEIPSQSLIENTPKLIIEEGCATGNLTIIFCNDEELLLVNRQFLDHDFYTDIITFDYRENDLISGDLFISVDRIKENALRFSVSANEELHRVVFHGVLHILGYNDKTTSEVKAMRAKENYYLNKLFHVKH